MHARDAVRLLSAIAFLVGATLTISPLGAQTGAKVLTPPKRDTTTRPQTATRPPATATAPAPTPANAAGAAGASRTVVVPQSALLDSIREVVFHALLDRDRSGFATLASAFCLSLSTDDFKKPSPMLDRADPPESMVRRLATSRSPARRASTCTFAPNAEAGRSVTGRALLYSVGAIDVSATDRAEAAAGYNYDGYSAGGFTFSLERSDSGWFVRQWRTEWTQRKE